MEELRNDIEFIEASQRPDGLVELRLDQYADLSAANLEATLRTFGPGNVVVTHRSPEEGGRKPDAADTERFYYLSQATTLGAAFVDVELTTIRRAPDAWQTLRGARQRETRFVTSFHDFKGSPSLQELRALRREAEEASADVVKFAVSAATLYDSLPLLELIGEAGWQRPFLGLVMGEAGFWSRVLGPRFPTPSPFTFARGCQAPGTAPGQPTWRELTDRYRFPQLQPDWPVYAVIGDPVADSFVPPMFNSALSEAQLPGLCLPLRVAGDPVAFVHEVAPKLGIQGISVSAPHTTAIREASTTCDALVKQIGAVDSLVLREEAEPAWEASHAEASGWLDTLKKELGGQDALRDRQILVLGAGSSGKAIACAGIAHDAKVLLWDEEPRRAQDLSAAIGAKCVLSEEITAALEAVAVINTTLIGMHPKSDDSPLEASRLPRGSLFLDKVYNPVETKLLKAARAGGHVVLDGLAMMVASAAYQFELFTGQPAPRARMRKALEVELLRRTGGF